MKKYLIAIIFIFLSINLSWAACGSWSGNTVTAGACTTTEINACLSEVTTSNVGEVTVNLPSCTINDTGVLSINMNDAKYTNVTKLSIIGNGTIPTGSTKGSAGNSVINRGSADANWLQVTMSTAKKFRLSNIRIYGGIRGQKNPVYINGTSLPSSGGGFRIDHCDFGTSSNYSYYTRQIWISGRIYGVIDHNKSYHRQQFTFNEENLGGNPSWNRGVDWGTSNAVYIEDNETYCMDPSKNWFFAEGRGGARYVIRYNTITGNHIGGHDATTGLYRSLLSYEVYNNTIDFSHDTYSGGSWQGQFMLRGGAYIIYNNTLTKSGTQTLYSAVPIRMTNNRSVGANASGVWVDDCDSTQVKICAGTLTNVISCSTDSNCGGESGSCQNIDGTSGIPCRDQIGTGNRSGTISTQLQSTPSLFWNNKATGTYSSVTYNDEYVAPQSATSDIQLNRDYCHHATTMPATCNSIATTYSAYTYPHPLTGADPTDTTDPVLVSVMVVGQQACPTNPSNVAISLGATDNVAVTGVRCCLNDGVTCIPATEYDDMDVVLTNTSGITWGTTVSSACDSYITYNCRATDAAGNFSNDAVIAYAMADNEDTDAPTMSTQAIGADGRTVTFTFSEAVTIGTGGSTGFTLTNGDSEEIGLTYVSGSASTSLVYQSSVCIPSTDTFTAGLVYTQPANGIEDMAGNDLASFSGAGAKTVTNGSTQACDLATSLFEHGESAPAGTANYSGNAVNLGVKFQTSTQGTMTHCWFYKIEADTGTHVCTVYRVFDGSVVGTVNFADESASGWQDQAFATALNIAADEDYIVTVSHPTGNWTSNVDYFASTYTNGNLTATTAGTDYAGRYVYGASMAYPTNDSARNYWTDFTMSYAGAGGPWQCTVSRTGDGCMVTGSQVVEDEGTCSATVTLRNGWKATWGGTCPAGSETNGVYTTGSVTADCTLVATCAEQYILP